MGFNGNWDLPFSLEKYDLSHWEWNMTMHFCFLEKGMIWYGSVKSWGGGGGGGKNFEVHPGGERVIGVPR